VRKRRIAGVLMARVAGSRGLWFDDHAKGWMEVTIPGTGGWRRRRKSLAASSREEAKAIHARFRVEVLGSLAGVRVDSVPTLSEAENDQRP
jgi:hypothetical protein